jgi:hypothetical protein
MNTKQHQQLILELIKEKETSSEADESYARHLKNSLELEVARDISIWWRSMQIERYCLITANYLKLTSQFNDVIKAFYRATNVSPYIERVGQSFLDYVQQSDDQLLATIANFEDKLKRVKKGDDGKYSIAWQHEPFAVLDLLIKGEPLELESIKGNYLTIIDLALENQFEVVDLN